jgi:hypothetical protein
MGMEKGVSLAVFVSGMTGEVHLEALNLGSISQTYPSYWLYGVFISKAISNMCFITRVVSRKIF